jgi:hypothetical protein
MKSAQEILRIKEEKRQQKIRENAELVNKELFELEKVLNKYETDDEDSKRYVTVPLIITTNEVKELLKQNGYIIDKISNNIEVNTTRIWLSEEGFNQFIRANNFLNNMSKNTEKVRIQEPNESTLKRLKESEEFWSKFINSLTEKSELKENSPRMYAKRRNY